jgi:hypothetical protein
LIQLLFLLLLTFGRETLLYFAVNFGASLFLGLLSLAGDNANAQDQWQN